MDYFITNLWNFNKVPFIDEEKTDFTAKGGTYTCNLYLKPHIHKCPFCDNANIKIKDKETIHLNHALQNMEYASINFHKRKYRCNNCGKNFYEKIDDLQIDKNTTLYFRTAILLKLKDSSLTYQKIAKKYKVSKTYVADLFDYYVCVDRHKLTRIVSIDEIYSRRLTKTKYCCVLYNPEENEILDILDSRRKNTLTDYFKKIDKNDDSELNSVLYFTSDLNETYRSIHDEFFKNSIHAADSFHVIKNLNDRFNDIRIRVMKELSKYKDDNDFDYWLLKKFNWMFLTGLDNVKRDTYYFKKRKMTLTKYQIYESMKNVDEELKNAVDLKDEYINFNKYYSHDEAKDKLEELINSFLLSDSIEMQSFGTLLINWKQEILNSFIKVDGWRLSNGKLERTNRAIKLLFAISYGYSNFPRARNRIMFSFNSNEPIENSKREFNNKRITEKRGHYNKK